MTEKASEIGRYLQHLRKSQNIPLEAVSRLTRISMTNLRHIEEEAWERLPAPVFVKGFLRAFAESIGADPQEVLKRYEARRQIMRRNERSRGQIHSGTRFWGRLFLSAICLAVVIGGTVTLARKMEPSNPEVPQAKPDTRLVETSQNPVGETPQPDQSAQVEAPAPQALTASPQASLPQEQQLLTVSAVEATRLKVIADAHKPEQFNLKPGDELTLKAERQFNLLIDNAGGVRLTFNGKAVALPNKSGRTLTLQLP